MASSNMLIYGERHVIIVSMHLRYFVPQILITGKMLDGYLMFSVKNIVQNVKLIELWG